MSDEYITVDCIFIRCTAKAVLIDVDGNTHWIPRSCIHGADERLLDRTCEGDEINLQIFEWLVEREGLA